MVKCVIITNESGEPIRISKVKDFTEQEIKELQKFCDVNEAKAKKNEEAAKEAIDKFKWITERQIAELKKQIRRLELEIEYDRGNITAEELEKAKGEIDND